MRSGKTIFAQVMEWIHPEQFRRCVQRYHGNVRVRNFPCWDQFLAMSFAQITYRDSLADIEVCLRSRPEQLYHMGFRSTVAHSTLADANGSRARFSGLEESVVPAASVRVVTSGIAVVAMFPPGEKSQPISGHRECCSSVAVEDIS